MSGMRMTGDGAGAGDGRLTLIAAFAAVYIIWGSTYLAIRFAIETLPPFLMAGVRFVIAGGILYAWARFAGASRPGRLHWKSAVIIGGFLLLGGNGGVVWAEQTVPSGLTALIVALVPLWMVLFDWLRGTGSRPGLATALGLLLGFVGVGLLVGPNGLGSGARIDPVGAGVVVLASVFWAIGSLYARQAEQPTSQSLSTGMQMFAGGALLVAAGIGTGELAQADPAAFSARSLIAFVYLIIFGALIGFSAYIYILRKTTPARAATYAYVNPVVAVVLGWAMASEPLSPRILLAGAMIVTAVVLIVGRPVRRKSRIPGLGEGRPATAAASVHAAPVVSAEPVASRARA